METPHQVPEEPSFPANACQHCGNPDVDNHYEVKLCANCRHKHARRKFSLWLKIVTVVGVALLALLILNGGKISGYWQMKRANKAYEQGQFVTAYQAYNRLGEMDTKTSTEVACKKAMCCFHNFEIDLFMAELSGLEDVTIENPQLYESLNTASERMARFLSMDKDSFHLQVGRIPVDSLSVMENFLKSELQKDPENLMAVYRLSDLYFDQQKYQPTLDMLLPVLKKYPDHQGLRSLGIACYRELKQYNMAEALSEDLFQSNHESLIGYAALCRLELKRKQDKQALAYARKAYDLDSTNTSSIISMMMAAHFNQLLPGRDYYLQKLSPSSIAAKDLVYYQNLMAPNTTWRD